MPGGPEDRAKQQKARRELLQQLWTTYDETLRTDRPVPPFNRTLPQLRAEIEKVAWAHELNRGF